jgi:hypothetical protein
MNLHISSVTDKILVFAHQRRGILLQDNTGHVELGITEFSGRKLVINHAKVKQFYTH